jgi:arylsulfatase A-like enzyme
MIAEQLGCLTYMIGKYHLLPSEFESPAGPFDRWPLGRGFERFYGFLGGDTSQWYPGLVYDNHQVEPPGTPDEGYHLAADLADKAIQFIADAKQVAPGNRSTCISARVREMPRCPRMPRKLAGDRRTV